ncbi:hypothetical protein [Streptomyces cinnamoneus]|uniref:hypothetical protein n=1 Tax=Streptomyces cinnamoneus TaxID=53446 RepID=UPI003B968465
MPPGGDVRSSSAAASIMIWEIAVYARTQAAWVSSHQVAVAWRERAPIRDSPTAG